jgi:hypothetical protein
MYKHSFYARKVVCDERNEREKREESSVTLGLNTLNTKKKRKISRLKLHQKQLALSLLLLL